MQSESSPAAPTRELPATLRLLRRLHSYLGIALVPWLFMYAAGAFVLNHRPLMDSWFRADEPEWNRRLQREYHRPIPARMQATPQQTRQIAQEILNDLGMGNQMFAANRPDPNRLVIHTSRFLGATRITYRIDLGQIVIHDQAFRFDRFLAGMHVRGGFHRPPVLTKVWAGIVDLVALSAVLWVISGLYIWWKAHRRHSGGALVLAAGAICYAVLVAVL